MERNQYLETSKKYSHLKATELLGTKHFIFELIFTGLALCLSLSQVWFFWVAGQILLFVAMWRWFSVLHSCSHNAFFKSKMGNNIAGHVASLFALIPYLGWKHTHIHHHQWTGWKDLDPVMDYPSVADAPNSLKKTMDFCWKYHIPFFSIFFVVKVFWNLESVNQLKASNGKSLENTTSLLFLILGHASLIYLLGWNYITVFGLPALFYMSASDFIVLSQHTRLPMNRAEGSDVKAFHYYEQTQFSRSLQYPGWISRFILLHFDKHTEHHLFPKVPHYFLDKIKEPIENPVGWIDWFKHIKSLPGHLVALEDKKDE